MKQPIDSNLLKSAEEARNHLIEGNRAFMEGEENQGDTTHERRALTAENGQTPYALIICCGDSRVPPEHIFSAGIGDLFVVRNAGHVVGPVALGSIEYAMEHLLCKLVVVLGHVGCGAVAAAIKGGATGNVKEITNVISEALNGETDPRIAEILNVNYNVEKIKDSSLINHYIKHHGLEVQGAIYDIADGEVSFMDVVT